MCKPLDLEYYIEKSGMKIGKIAEAIGVSRSTFNNKRKGITDFTIPEMYMLSDILNIPKEEKGNIFFRK